MFMVSIIPDHSLTFIFHVLEFLSKTWLFLRFIFFRIFFLSYLLSDVNPSCNDLPLINKKYVPFVSCLKFKEPTKLSIKF